MEVLNSAGDGGMKAAMDGEMINYVINGALLFSFQTWRSSCEFHSLLALLIKVKSMSLHPK